MHISENPEHELERAGLDAYNYFATQYVNVKSGNAAKRRW
jgi:hypothetical protein